MQHRYQIIERSAGLARRSRGGTSARQCSSDSRGARTRTLRDRRAARGVRPRRGLAGEGHRRAGRVDGGAEVSPRAAARPGGAAARARPAPPRAPVAVAWQHRPHARPRALRRPALRGARALRRAPPSRRGSRRRRATRGSHRSSSSACTTASSRRWWPRTPPASRCSTGRSTRGACSSLRVGPQNFELRVLDFGLAPHADWFTGGVTSAPSRRGGRPRRPTGRRPPSRRMCSRSASSPASCSARCPSSTARGEGSRRRRGTPSAGPPRRLPTSATRPSRRSHADFQRLWRASTATPQEDVARAPEVAAKIHPRRRWMSTPPSRTARPEGPARPPGSVPSSAARGAVPGAGARARVDPYEDAAVQVMPPIARPADPPG